jgi:hypothetical protein
MRATNLVPAAGTLILAALTLETSSLPLSAVDFHFPFALARADAAVSEVDSFDRSAIAGKIDNVRARSLSKAKARSRTESLIVAESDNHVVHFDRGVFDSYLKLPETTFALSDLDAIVLAAKIDVA